MIRRLMHMIIFTTTILTASFGQEYFGRDQIVSLAHKVKQEGPQHIAKGLKHTDSILEGLAAAKTANPAAEKRNIPKKTGA